MRLSPLLSLTSAVAGGLAAWRVLSRRHGWEQQNKRVAVCVDYDDMQSAAIRAGLSLDTMLSRLHENGATHVSLPEWTFARLQKFGQLTPQAPQHPITGAPSVGHWNYLHGEGTLVSDLAAELQARLPHIEAVVLDSATLSFAGDLPTIGQLGLGFDTAMADRIKSHGLSVVPRPVSYDWPQKSLLERSLSQAAQVGRFVAFAGDMILGHEMHLDETVDALAANDLSFVYFAESRHQKGDWFVAKRRLPHVVLGHRFTLAEMIPLDYHAACHNWVHYARERGIRFCYLNFFRVLHATAPLEGLAYVHHLKHALEDAGFEVSAEIDLPVPVPEPDSTGLTLTGLATAGIATHTFSRQLNLPERAALPLMAAAAAGAMALPFVEESRNQAAIGRHDHEHLHSDHDGPHSNHEHSHGHSHDHADLAALYPPSYTPKLLALGLTTLSPLAGLPFADKDNSFDWLSGQVYQIAAGVSLAAVTSGREYHTRIETYRGFNLDWFLPLAGLLLQSGNLGRRSFALVGLLAAWWFVRQQQIDLLAQIDPGHAEGHTHHISAAMALVGDIQMALGPRPARKWAGLGPLASAVSHWLAKSGRRDAAVLASALSIAGTALGLTGFRRPERSIQETARLASLSYGVGMGLGLLALLASRNEKSGNP